ncbi:hypothetical protein HMPREF0058_1541 [Actinomyces urogenitalis DSM 15434]|uniref:Uncharacterized protein n=1 Tax=Actinomyces urogenitalis DSM 15434 TaxID=525246 RepID=C0W6P7_9ACTO|nr:hypothetical protein HMPREF0058_1541 [Actinomyces urogenitalis DSM 15434]
MGLGTHVEHLSDTGPRARETGPEGFVLCEPRWAGVAWLAASVRRFRW